MVAIFTVAKLKTALELVSAWILFKINSFMTASFLSNVPLLLITPGKHSIFLYSHGLKALWPQSARCCWFHHAERTASIFVSPYLTVADCVSFCSSQIDTASWRTPAVTSHTWWPPPSTSKSPHLPSTISQRSLPPLRRRGPKVRLLPQVRRQHQWAQPWLAGWETCPHRHRRSLMVFALFMSFLWLFSVLSHKQPSHLPAPADFFFFLRAVLHAELHGSEWNRMFCPGVFLVLTCCFEYSESSLLWIYHYS